MVSALFREIHTAKCKKLFFFSFICSYFCKRCKTPHPQPTLLKMMQENTPGPSLNSSLGPLSAGEQAFCVIFLTPFTFSSLFFLYCASERKKKSQSTPVPKIKAIYLANHIAKNWQTLFFCKRSKFKPSKVVILLNVRFSFLSM